jgi:hypothetical protein
MLRKLTDLQGYAIRATDDFIGTVSDFYFDDDDWGVRYLIVDTGKWLSGRKVLISPLAIGPPDWTTRGLTKAQVERSPDIDTRKPVSRQHEAEYFRYYGYPYYWSGAGLWGMGGYPGSLTTQGRITEDVKAHATHATPAPDDCHLRSSKAVIGYHIKATDGDIGHLEDLLVDDYTWAIRYLIVVIIYLTDRADSGILHPWPHQPLSKKPSSTSPTTPTAMMPLWRFGGRTARSSVHGAAPLACPTLPTLASGSATKGTRWRSSR